MIAAYLISAGVGLAIVLQAGANRVLARSWSLSAVLAVGGVVLTLASVALWGLARVSPAAVPDIFRVREGGPPVAWWFWIPGLLGFSIVAGIPYAISRIGALPSMALVIAAQLGGSLLWDMWMEGQAITWLRLAGAVVTMAGALITMMRA
jgi:transporter family-2 protein